MFNFGKKKNTTTGGGGGGQSVPTSKQAHQSGKHRWDFVIMFSWLLLLGILELGFTCDTFQYLQRKHAWSSKKERSRISFLLFSSLRSTILASVYIGSHLANKWFKSLHHTIFLVLNTIFWIVGGVLVKQTLGVVECGGVGQLKGGLSECHELKIIEILAWITAASSILICIPVVMGAMTRQKHKAEKGETEPQKRNWFSKLGLKKSKPRSSMTSGGGGGLLSEKHHMGNTANTGTVNNV